MDQATKELSASQLSQLCARFDLANERVSVVNSGWHKLVVLVGDRAFAFPRSAGRVHMIEREAAALSAWHFALAPRFLGLHHDPAIWPYPWLEMTRLEGRSWDVVKDGAEAPSFEQAAGCLENLARLAAAWHVMATPPRMAARPLHVGGGLNEPPSIHPRLSDRWTCPGGLSTMTQRAAELLSAELNSPEPDLWMRALAPVISMDFATLHGELSDGQFLVDEAFHITGVVDWDGMHRGHPLIDLDLGVGAGRVYYDRYRYNELRRRSRRAYARERGLLQPTWPQINLLWCLLDALALLHDGGGELWSAVITALNSATERVRQI